MLLHASANTKALSRPQACSRDSTATRPVAGCAVRGLLRPQLIIHTAGTAPKLCDTRTRAVRADQATDTVDSALLQTIAQITEKVDAAVASTLAASAEAAAVTAVPSDSELRAKVVRGVEKLQKGLLERETEVRRGADQSIRQPATTSAHDTHLGRDGVLLLCHRSACCCWHRCVASTCCCWVLLAQPSRSWPAG